MRNAKQAIGFSVVCLGLVIGCTRVLADPGVPVPSVWELVEVSPVSMMNSNPRGLSNHREYYTEDGRLCFLAPADTFPARQECLKVSFSEGKRILTTQDGEQHSSEIVEISKEELTLSYPDESKFWFKRLGDQAFDSPVAPNSLHVLRVGEGPQLLASEVQYVEPPKGQDSRPIVGVWETIEFRDVPYADLPPYGFPNQKWIFTGTYFVKLDPNETEISSSQATEYQLEESKLYLSGDAEALDVSFSKWGDLILSYSGGQITLRQISKDPQVIPKIPTKISLLVPGNG